MILASLVLGWLVSPYWLLLAAFVGANMLQAAFTGEATGGPRVLDTALGVRRFVFNVPGAIGYMRLSEVDDTIKVIHVDGLGPTDPGYRLTVAARPPGTVSASGS